MNQRIDGKAKKFYFKYYLKMFMDFEKLDKVNDYGDKHVFIYA